MQTITIGTTMFSNIMLTENQTGNNKIFVKYTIFLKEFIKESLKNF